MSDVNYFFPSATIKIPGSPLPPKLAPSGRGYTDFERLYTLTQGTAFFIIRAKSNLQFRRLYSHSVKKTTGLMCDQTIVLTNFYSSKGYPEKLRRIKFYDLETGKTLVFLTNNFLLPPLTIAQLYRCRWQIELFFKWIKQHLRIKSFFGITENAVKTQIWIAVSVYVLIAIIKKSLHLNLSLYTILQILSVTIFERTPLLLAVTDLDDRTDNLKTYNQLNLFD